MSTEVALSRWKLYARVWETPISRLAAELGISDTGLRKACIRHDIPVPSRGHWARVSAGQDISASPLPRPADDDVVWLMPTGPRLKVEVPNIVAPTEHADISVAVPTSLDGCHTLVAKTARFFASARAELERQQRRRTAASGGPNWSAMSKFHVGRLYNGRISSGGDGCLHIVTTLRNIDWILRFHEALIRSLLAQGLRVVPSDSDSSVRVVGHGSYFLMSFMEDFEKRQKPGAAWPDTAQYLAKDSYKLKFRSRLSDAPKIWHGSQAKLEDDLPTLAAHVTRRLAEQAVRDRLRSVEDAQRKAKQKACEAAAAARAAERELQRKRTEAQQIQAKRLLEAARAHADYQRAIDWLDSLERQPGQDASTIAWVTVARAGLADPLAALLRAVRHEAGQAEKPLWSPEPPPTA